MIVNLEFAIPELHLGLPRSALYPMFRTPGQPRQMGFAGSQHDHLELVDCNYRLKEIYCSRLTSPRLRAQPSRLLCKERHRTAAMPPPGLQTAERQRAQAHM